MIPAYPAQTKGANFGMLFLTNEEDCDVCPNGSELPFMSTIIIYQIPSNTAGPASINGEPLN